MSSLPESPPARQNTAAHCAGMEWTSRGNTANGLSFCTELKIWQPCLQITSPCPFFTLQGKQQAFLLLILSLISSGGRRTKPQANRLHRKHRIYYSDLNLKWFTRQTEKCRIIDIILLKHSISLVKHWSGQRNSLSLSILKNQASGVLNISLRSNLLVA